MPSQHRHSPISIRPPERLRDWLTDYAERHGRSLREVVTEALEEYRARREQEGSNTMLTVTTAHARDCLRRTFIYNFMRDQMVQAPIYFPGIEYSRDGTLSDHMKVLGTEHLIGILRDNGYVIRLSNGTGANTALHHVLWDQWAKEEIGNGRFTGRLFDDYGKIYLGCTADDAANYTIERLAALDADLCSYTIQEDGPQT
jgi:hypothetical protein